jgi:hypothetical protein
LAYFLIRTGWLFRDPPPVPLLFSGFPSLSAMPKPLMEALCNAA